MVEFHRMKPYTGDPARHAATEAWRRLGPERPVPERIVILKERSRNRYKSKSAVYRLEGVGPSGCAVVAKRSRVENARTERTIYEHVLPRLGIETLRYHGCAEEDERHWWLFMDDAGEESYRVGHPRHRNRVIRWLARLHVSASRFAGTVPLPDRGPDHYRQRGRAARCLIEENLDNPALRDEDRATLMSISATLEILDQHWDTVEDLCRDLPRTLVHGDFVGKNVCVSTDGTGVVVRVFDWESAGWGVPAPDLEHFTGQGASQERAAYLATVRGAWPRLGPSAVDTAAWLGRAFRCIAAIDWDATCLPYEWVEATMYNMQVYDRKLPESMLAAGLHVMRDRVPA